MKANAGAAGIDGMTRRRTARVPAGELAAIEGAAFAGTYRPQPVRRVEIPKSGGGTRKLGIPTVVDRFVQQAVLQVLQKRWDPTFSEYSYGFRPGRSAHQAVAKAQEYIQQGYDWVVDLDLEKFFDRVNHDVLMSRVARRISDKRMLKLIRGFLNSGVMENGLVGPTEEGTPQGGPLSPLLSNLLLDDLDRELERRGHRFVRYADDCNIYVKSERAGQRVMEGVKRFLTRKLRLKVNESKSAVARPKDRKFLGFSFTRGESVRRRIAPQGHSPLQGTDSRTDTAHTRNQYRADDRRASHLHDRMAELLRILRDPQHTQGLGWMDPKASALLSVEAVETRDGPFQGTEEQGSRQRPRRKDGRECAWTMAAEQQPRAELCAAECFLRLPRLPVACSLNVHSCRTAVCGPACTVV